MILNRRFNLQWFPKMIIAALCTCSSIQAQHLTSLNDLLPLDSSVRTGKLANGFTYYIRHNAEPKNRVVMYLAAKVGSLMETDDQQGLAHFVEHMSFNGTKHFPKNKMIDYLQRSGVRFGADINAYTGFDETVYQLPLPSDDVSILENGIQIMRDWAQDALLDAVEINKERGVILEEQRLGKGASERMQRQYLPQLLNDSRYAHRLPIGQEAILKNFRPETLRAFYRDWYRPGLQALIVVGDVNVEQMERIIKMKFGDLKNPLNQKPRLPYGIPLTGKNQFLIATDPEMSNTVVQVYIKSQAPALQTLGDYRSAIIRSLVNGMLDQRYRALAQQPNPAFLKGSAGITDFVGNVHTFTVTAVARHGSDDLKRAFQSVWKETVRAQKFGFTAPELGRAKLSYLNAIESAFRERNKTASDKYVQEYLQHFLKHTAVPGIGYEYQLVQQLLRAVSLAEVNEMFNSYVKTTDRDIVIMAPTDAKRNLPDSATFRQWLAVEATEQLVPYTEDTNTMPLLNHPPVKGTILSETRDTFLNITTLQLSNGIRVLLKPTNFKNNEVLFSGFAPGGTNLYNDPGFQSANYSAALINAFGAGNYSPTDLTRYLTGRKIGMRMAISERKQYLSGAAASSDLPAAMELLYAYLQEPRKDTQLFHSLITRTKETIATRHNDPASIFQDSVSAILGNYNIRRTGPSIEKLDQLSLDRVYEIYQERFGNSAGYTFTFVGNFQVDSLKPLLEKYLASMPGSTSSTRDLGIHIPPGRIERTIYAGMEQKSTVQLYFSGEFIYSPQSLNDLNALQEVLSIRLLERLREEESGVYSPSVGASGFNLPADRYTFAVSFGSSPENVDRLIAATLDEIEKLKSEGPRQVDLDKWKAESIRTHETDLQTNRWWLEYLDQTQQDSMDLHTLEKYVPMIKRTTVASVRQAAINYLSGRNYVRIVQMPNK